MELKNLNFWNLKQELQYIIKIKTDLLELFRFKLTNLITFFFSEVLFWFICLICIHRAFWRQVLQIAALEFGSRGVKLKETSNFLSTLSISLDDLTPSSWEYYNWLSDSLYHPTRVASQVKGNRIFSKSCFSRITIIFKFNTYTK